MKKEIIKLIIKKKNKSKYNESKFYEFTYFC